MSTMTCNPATFINENAIAETLRASRGSDAQRVRDILGKARELQGLEAGEIATLMQLEDPALLEEMFAAARQVKNEIYGNRLVLFAPLYISNLCHNECVYCAFRARNKTLTRRALTQAEIANETRILIEQGHKRVLLVAGEAYPKEEGLDYVLNAVETIYATRGGTYSDTAAGVRPSPGAASRKWAGGVDYPESAGFSGDAAPEDGRTPAAVSTCATRLSRGEIRRVNVNIAPLTVEEFKRLKDAKIGTYQLFQETYHRATYQAVHLGGPKRDYDWRTTAFDRAMEAGIDDVGVGVLFGLYDWKFEMLALQQHIRHLEEKFGVGPHTISVPRMEPAVGSTVAYNPPHPVSDTDFKKLVAILRLAVPYTGIIMSTRENADTRRATFELGVSQISAGSRCNPGGYAELNDAHNAEQFQLGDHRSLDEVVRDVASLGYTPSFCTACYRLGRTGADFMDLAKPGLIKHHCAPNALSSCMEYLLDYARPATRAVGEKLVAHELSTMENSVKSISSRLVAEVRADKRDVYV